MEPLGAAASVIAVMQLSAKVIGYINGVSGSTKERKRLRESVRGCEQVLRRIMDEVDDCEEGEGWSEMIKAIDAPEAPLGRLSAALSIIQSKLQPRRGIKKVASTLSWPFNENEVDKLLAAIEREKALLGLVLNVDCLQLIREIRKTAKDNQRQLEELLKAVKRSGDENETSLREISGGLRRVEESQNGLGDQLRGLQIRHDDHDAAIKRKAILDWLTPVDYAIPQSTFVNRQQKGTGTWLLKSDEFKGWIKDGSTLFCPGIPGAGKTIITSIVVQDLVTRSRDDNDTAIAYIYLDYLRRHEQKVEDLLTNILKQLSDYQSSMPSELDELYKKHTSIGRRTRPSFQEISNVLQCVTALYPRTFIVIDALDECDDSDGSRSRLLHELKNLQQKSGAKLFATSRHIPDIVAEFQGCATLEIRAADQDILAYLEGRSLELPKCASRSPSLKEEIKQGILRAADGMFLLAQLNFDSLKGKKSATAVRTALKDLPAGSQAYHRAYDVAMERIEGQLADQAEIAKQVLSWITFAKKPLRPEELEDAIAVIDGQRIFDFENICPVEDLISTCAGLVTIDEETEAVRLVHYTTQQYFEGTCNRWFPDAQSYLAHTCVTYLSLDDFRSGRCRTGRQYRIRESKYALYHYASLHWGHHALSASETSHTIMSFLESDRKTNASSQVLVVENDFFQAEVLDHTEWDDDDWDCQDKECSLDLDTYGTGLHLASYFGLNMYVDALLGNSALAPDLGDRVRRTPLSWAAKRGHEAVITLLLAKGADVETKDMNGRSPLSWAAAEGQDAVVKLLIDNGADVNSKDNQGQMPIFFATLHCHEATVALLLDEGADVESAAEFDHTPLVVAVGWGYQAIASLLLRREAPVQSGQLRNAALSKAIEGQRVGIAKLLLDHGAEMCAAHLFMMSSKHCRAMVELLVFNGADIEAKDEQGQTPLSLAVRRSYAQVFGNVERDAKTMSPRDRCLDLVKYLLDQGADIETRDDQGRTPLSWAAERGFVAVVKMLLEHGADVESRDERGRTPLVLAIQEGRGMAAAQLIDQGGARFEPHQWYSATRLLFAAVRGRRRAVEILLGKQINAAGKQDSPLTLTKNGVADIVETLVDMGADIDSRDEHARTPLSWAAKTWDEASIKILLDRGADAESTDEEGWTPLLWAVGTEDDRYVRHCLGPDADPDEPGDAEEPGKADYRAVVQLLLDNGANIESKDRERGRTPLSWAVLQGSRVAVQVLLENGADVYAKDKAGQEPRDLAKENKYRDDTKLLESAMHPYQEEIGHYYSSSVHSSSDWGCP